jgi:flagellar biosynthetic protein FlhB
MAQHDKTEQPTQRRREKARREGQFAVSRELVTAAQFVTFLALLVAWADSWEQGARRLMRTLLEQAFYAPEAGSGPWLHGVIGALWQPLLAPMAMAGAVMGLAALAVQLAVTRLGLNLGRVAPDLKRLNPEQRLRQLPRQNAANLVVALLILPLFAAGLWWIWTGRAPWLATLASSGVESGVRLIASVVEDLLWTAAALFVLVALWDFWRQRRRWESEMRMTKQEVREEMKETEGNPQIKQKIRRMMRDLARRRMMQDVDTATAVIVNPTHYAVAVRYVASEMAAPRVVAKGRNYLALRIRERAIRAHVPIVENPPLAQALYRSAHVGQEIPAHFYRAVAEVLAYIYRLINRRQ